MPELPEVETIARSLRQGGRSGAAVLGFEIAHAKLLLSKALILEEGGPVLDDLKGQKISVVDRRGKYLRIHLDQDTVLIHLRMSGDIRVEQILDENGFPREAEKHDRFLIEFANSMRLAFNDTRKFGRVWLTSNPDAVLAKLGPEPLDESFSAADLFALLQARKRQIKPMLMDQHVLAGLGNIYTDEALFQAGIHPLSISNMLSSADARRLHQAIQDVLREGIKRNGASIDWVYRGGEFQNTFQVYQRTGKPCYQCGEAVQRMVVGQRGTHYCPNCQKRK